MAPFYVCFSCVCVISCILVSPNIICTGSLFRQCLWCSILLSLPVWRPVNTADVVRVFFFFFFLFYASRADVRTTEWLKPASDLVVTFHSNFPIRQGAADLSHNTSRSHVETRGASGWSLQRASLKPWSSSSSSSPARVSGTVVTELVARRSSSCVRLYAPCAPVWPGAVWSRISLRAEMLHTDTEPEWRQRRPSLQDSRRHADSGVCATSARHGEVRPALLCAFSSSDLFRFASLWWIYCDSIDSPRDDTFPPDVTWELTPRDVT